MSVTYGFFNALNHDRRYNAIQMSMIFDGIITDGIFSTIGDCMRVEANEGMIVNVGSGRAWFNHTWTYNDSKEPIGAPQSELVLNRIDALVLEINASETVRANSFKFVKGTPSSTPTKPELTNTEDIHQYPLAYITIPAGSTEITQSQIENTVGTSTTPFITGILQQVEIDALLLQWKAQWDEFIAQFEADSESWSSAEKAEFEQTLKGFETRLTAFEEAYGKEFTDWFGRLEDILDENTAGHLQNEIDEITETEFNRYYGLFASKTVINDSTDTITTTTSEATMTTTFSTSATGVETITTTIVMNSGNFDYIKTTVITPTATGDEIETTYVRRGK